MSTTWKSLALAGLMTCTLSVSADEITDAVESGLEHYGKKDYSAAAAQLDYAATLIRQLKAEAMVSIFPEPLSGWTAETAESEAGGAAFAAGINASRSYRSNDGNKSVDIEVVTDSPMLQSMMMMFSNPSMIAMQGGKVTRVQGQTAMLKNEDGDISLTLLANNALVTVEGYGASEDEVKAYAEAIDLKGL